jgi:hypothetical protein
MKMIKKFRSIWEGARRVFIECPEKIDPEETKAYYDSADEEGRYVLPQLDKVGREIPDPRPLVVEVKPLTKEQKIFNQFVAAHNKAVLERDNLLQYGLDLDFTTPETAKASIDALLDLDMPDEVAEFVSEYEYIPMAEDWPELPPVDPQPAPPPVPPSTPPDAPAQ